MNTLNLKKRSLSFSLSMCIALCLITALCGLVNRTLLNSPTAGQVDPGFLQVILFAFFVWFLLLLSAWLIARKLAAKLVQIPLSNYQPLKKLSSWQQYVYSLALYALVLLSGTGCLMVIC